MNPVRLRQTQLLLPFLFFLFSPIEIAFARVVVNEVYYDHPGADSGYEFIELFNAGPESVDLVGGSLWFHNGTGDAWELLWNAPPASYLAAGGLLVIGGEMVSAADIVASLSLQNGAEAVRWLNSDAVEDVLGYGDVSAPGLFEGTAVGTTPSGQSWSRIPDGVDTDNNAVDFTLREPSPGRRNLPADDIGVSFAKPQAVLPATGAGVVDVVVSNLGVNSVPESAVQMILEDSLDGVWQSLATATSSQTIAPGADYGWRVSLLLVTGYHHLRARAVYPNDESVANNVARGTLRVGTVKLRVSEVMSSPREGCPQFVEIANIGAQSETIDGITLRDKANSPRTLVNSPAFLRPGEVLVVTESMLELFACHGDGMPAVEVDGSWPTLNRSGSGGVADSVVVSDRFGLPIDAVAYPPQPSATAGQSLERVDLFGGQDAVWLVSGSGGPSPGRIGDVGLVEPPSRRVDVSPRSFVSGQVVRVVLSELAGLSVSASVFDRRGRHVATIGNAQRTPSVMLWTGQDDSGASVPAGIYVVACEWRDGDGTTVAVDRVVIGCAR